MTKTYLKSTFALAAIFRLLKGSFPINSKILLCALGFTFVISSANAQIDNNHFKVDVASENMGPCGGLNNGTTNVLVMARNANVHNFEIAFSLPEGISYVSNTVVLTSQNGSADYTLTVVDESNLKMPIFRLERPDDTSWQPNDEVSFTFQKTASCDAVTHSYNGGLFKDRPTITYTDAAGDKTVTDNNSTINTYSFLSAFLAVDNIPVIVGHTNDTDLRDVIIQNSGNGNLQMFEHQVEISSGLLASYQLSFNGVALIPSISNGNFKTYIIDLNAPPFAGEVGDGDNLFENERITLTETIRLEDCANLQSTKHSPRWGCSAGNYCQVGTAIVGSFVTQQVRPELTLTTINKPKPRFDGPVTYTYAIGNASNTSPAYNVQINMGYLQTKGVSSKGKNPFIGDGPDTHRQLSDFRFTGGANFTPQRWLNTDEPGSGSGSYYLPEDFFAFDPDGPGGLEDLDNDGFYDDLAANGSTEINLDLTMLPNNDSCGRVLVNYVGSRNLTMDTWSLNLCDTASPTLRENLNRHYIRSPALFNYNFPKSYDRDVDEGRVTHITFRETFEASGNEPTCNGIKLFSNDPSTSYNVAITVPTGILLDDSADARYSQTGNTINFRETNLKDFERNSFQLAIPVDVPITIDCATYTGPSHTQLAYKITYDSDCFDRDLHCGVFEIRAHCQTSCVGPVTQSFDANRTTTGWTDETMTTKVVLDPLEHNLKVYMPKDEMVLTSSAIIRGGAQDNLSFRMRYRTSFEGTDTSDIIEFMDGTISIFDVSSGSSQSFPITSSPTISTKTGNDHFATFDLTEYQQHISSGYKYGEGGDEDEISLQLHFRFKDEFPDQADLLRFFSFEGSFFSMNATNKELNCDFYSDSAAFFQTEIEMGVVREGDSLTSCDDEVIIVGFNQVSGMGDRFPNEFRPPAIWENIKFEIPEGIVFKDLITTNYPSLQPENESPTSMNGGLDYTVSNNIVTVTPGPRFMHIDQGGNKYHQFYFYVGMTSAVPPAAPFQTNATYLEYAYSNTSEVKTEGQNRVLDYYLPPITLSANEPILLGNTKKEGFEVDLCAASTSVIANNWLRVDNGPEYSITEAFLVASNGSETKLNFSSEGDFTILELGDIAASVGNNKVCKKIRFQGTYTGIDPKNIQVSHFYDCQAYPTDYAALPSFNEIDLKLVPTNAALQLNILNQPSTTVDICSDFLISLEVRNAGEGDLIAPRLEFLVPGDMTSLDLKEIAVEYPRSSGIIEIIAPTFNGNIVAIDLMQHPGILSSDGIVGSNRATTLDQQIAILNITANPQCNYRSNTGFTYTGFGLSPFGEETEGNGSKLATDRIILTGAEPTYSTYSTIGMPATTKGCNATLVSIESTINGGTTGASDFTRIVLPQGLFYVTGSFNRTGGDIVTLSSVNTVGDRQELEILFPPDANGASQIGYTFEVTSAVNACAGDYEISLSTYVVVNGLSCQSTTCESTEIVTGQTASEITINKAIIASSSFASSGAYAQTGNGNQYGLEFGLQNTGNAGLEAGVEYSVFCADNTGGKVGNSIYEGVISQAIPVGSAIVENVFFNSTQLCGDQGNLLVEFLPSVPNCFCSALSLPIRSEQQNNLTDIEITMSPDRAISKVLENVTFTINVANRGLLDATGITIANLLPSGYTFVKATDNGVFTEKSITWPSFNLATSQSSTRSFTVLVNTPSAIFNEYNNSAQVTKTDQQDVDSTPNNYDGLPLEDDEAISAIEVDSADLSIQKRLAAASQGPLNVGDTVTFEIALANKGPNMATNVVIEDILPSGYSLAQIENEGIAKANRISWSLPVIEVGTTVLSYTVTVNEPTDTVGEYTNIAQVTASDQFDANSTPNNYNGLPLEDDEAIHTPVTQEVDLEVSKTVNKPEAAVGASVSFTVSVTNNGSDNATNIQVNDVLPAGYTLISTSLNLGTFTEQAGIWEIPLLIASNTATLQMEVIVTRIADYTNVAEIVTVDQYDSNPANDRDEAAISILEAQCLVVFNEFSPNNDGANDVFFIECIDQYTENFLQVFNRWGTKVFEMKSYNNSWAGTVMAPGTTDRTRKLPVGTYYYTLNLKDGNTPPMAGWLYITR